MSKNIFLRKLGYCSRKISALLREQYLSSREMIQYKDMTEIMKEAMIEANCLLICCLVFASYLTVPSCEDNGTFIPLAT